MLKRPLLILIAGLAAVFFSLKTSAPEQQVRNETQAAKPVAEVQAEPKPTSAIAKVDAVNTKLAVTQSEGFKNWLEQWQHATTTSEREGLVEVGLQLATERAASMKQLIRENPDTALDLALSYAEYAALPEAIQAIVEEPFSDSGSVDVTAICSEGITHYRLQYTNGDDYEIFMPERHRIASSKKSLPIQGIRLDGLAVLRDTVFQTVTDADATFVTQNWPVGQSNPVNDYATGAPIEGVGITAIAGGHVFYFQNEANLLKVETALQQADEMPAHTVSSQWILTEVSSNGFPFEAFSSEIVSANYLTTTGDKTALVIMVNFQDLAAPADQIALEQAIDVDVSNALAAYSYNTTSMDATIYGTVVTIDNNAADYLDNSGIKDYDDIHDEAVAAYLTLEGEGTPPPSSVYDTVCVYFEDFGLDWAGRASVGGQRMWLNGSPSTETILHEFGHNYGLKHANYWRYDNSNGASTDPVDPTGADYSYGDEFDVMGSGLIQEGHFHMGAKQYLGWIGASDRKDLSGSSDNGTYRVYRFDDIGAAGNQALRISKSATNDHYWVGYRKDYASLESFAKGAYLMWERADGSPSRNQSWLIDTTPQSIGGKNDAPITVGRTYSDTASDVHITPVALGGSAPNEYIDVVVNFGAFAGNASPVGSISGPTAIHARQLELFSVSATDSDGDTLAYSWDMGDGTVKSNSSSITHNWLTGGSYTVAVTVSDMKGGSVTLSKIVTVVDPLMSWSTRTSGTSQSLTGIASNSTHVVVVGRGSMILRSTDGSSWTDVSPSAPSSVSFNDVIWTGSEFIAVGGSWDSTLPTAGFEGVIYTSPTGSTWTRSYETNLAGTRLEGIAYDGSSTLVAVGESAIILRKSGAGAWTSIATTIVGTRVLRDIAYGDGSFVLVGHYADPSRYIYRSGDAEVHSSTDGLTWTDYSANIDFEAWEDFNEIEYVEGVFHASGYGGVYRSTDAGFSWSTTFTGDPYIMNGFASISGLHYAAGRNDSRADTDFISIDGMTWTEIDPGSLDDRLEVGTFAGTFITVGHSGSIRQSGSVASTGFDSFNATYFPGGGVDAEATANSDGDWAGNLTEYALGGDPTDGNSTPAMPLFSIDESGFSVLEVTRAGKQADVAYSIWWSTNLIDWTQEGLTLEVDDKTTLRVRSTNVTTAEENVFFRLLLSQ